MSYTSVIAMSKALPQRQHLSPLFTAIHPVVTRPSLPGTTHRSPSLTRSHNGCNPWCITPPLFSTDQWRHHRLVVISYLPRPLSPWRRSNVVTSYAFLHPKTLSNDVETEYHVTWEQRRGNVVTLLFVCIQSSFSWRNYQTSYIQQLVDASQCMHPFRYVCLTGCVPIGMTLWCYQHITAHRF